MHQPALQGGILTTYRGWGHRLPPKFIIVPLTTNRRSLGSNTDILRCSHRFLSIMQVELNLRHPLYCIFLRIFQPNMQMLAFLLVSVSNTVAWYRKWNQGSADVSAFSFHQIRMWRLAWGSFLSMVIRPSRTARRWLRHMTI